jgi:hypothetical protein
VAYRKGWREAERTLFIKDCSIRVLENEVQTMHDQVLASMRVNLPPGHGICDQVGGCDGVR